MKSSAAGIALLASLFLSQGCSSTTKTKDTSNNQQTQVQSLPEKTSENNQSESPSTQKQNSQPQISVNTQGKLTIPQKITPNQPVSIKVKVPAVVAKNSNDASQPKQMNLVVVSNDLRYFDLVQASYNNSQNIEVKPNFPAPGDYTVFSDYSPLSEKQQVAVEKVSVPGKVPFPTQLESFSTTKILSDTKIDLNLSQPNIKAGKEVTLKFSLKQADNKPIQDLKPYLGQKANLVVIKSSSPLVESDYIETETLKNSSNSQVNFTTKFPQPGTYKLWLQFNRNGKVKTADFWITVNS